ncbi:5-bromo-4-chloroindolyl phosphate hydrolysis family protein [Bacillus marasmi]|uniref:5-bromo-4-chloroindolyl phosphate hydrolysis family protein n=1 Tax=Bacillus marasmi TaxID=1926279 RepID=UPI0011C9F7BB|nr:5-bromo-4-chloroindolyl phosphate hydrolysis family protein [Bacillus marasmi]
MNAFISFLVGTFVTIPVAVSIWLISFFAITDHAFWPSSGISFIGGFLTFSLVTMVMKSRFLKKNQLSRKEYRYIKQNLEEAKQKINRLNKAAFMIREIPSFKQRIEIAKITRQIYKLTKKEPKRFYKAEQFYFSHLDSLVEITEKYALLSSQPKKNIELNQTLHDTRHTLNELTKTIEKDLYVVLSDDIDHLNFEVDVAKHSIKNMKDVKSLEESRLKK